LSENFTVDGSYWIAVEANVDLDRSGRFAARVIDHPDLPNRILPRGVSVSTHNSPVDFLRDGWKVQEKSSIEYLRKWVKGPQHGLQSDRRLSIMRINRMPGARRNRLCGTTNTCDSSGMP